MAKSEQRGIVSQIFALINPLRDPSMLIAVILTVIAEGGNSNTWYMWIAFFLLFWIAVKSVIWLLVNFAFSFVYLLRKTGWVMRNPRLAWRLLDALGTEEIIIGGLRPDMFATEEGGLHAGELGFAAAMGMQGYGPGAPNGGYLEDGYARQPQYSRGLDYQSQEAQELLSAYSRLIADWMGFTEEKWRAVSDSQLGWKPLRGRWGGWEEIYRDSFAADGYSAGGDPVIRRFDNAQAKGSAASAVVCFLHDLELLRQAMTQMEGGDVGSPRGGVMSQHTPISQRSAKGPIIRNPMIVDAD